MRSLYIVIGFFLGLNFACKESTKVFNLLSEKYDRELTAFALTGYAEGWTRRRDYTQAHIYWMLNECYAQSRKTK